MAANAPTQPALRVAKLEDVARDAVTTVLKPLLSLERQKPGFHPAPADMVAAFAKALDIVDAAIMYVDFFLKIRRCSFYLIKVINL